MLIIGLGNTAIPEQMNAPEKSMPAADTGGGNTAFSEIMSRVSEGKGEKTQAEPEKTKTDAAAEESGTKVKQEKTENKKKRVEKEDKSEAKKPKELKAAEKETSLASMLAAGEEKTVEKPEEVSRQALKSGLNGRLQVSEEAAKPETGAASVHVQIGIGGDESLLPNRSKGNGKSSDPDSKKEKPKLKIIDTRQKKNLSGEKQVKTERGVELEKPLTQEASREGISRERQLTLVENESGMGKERELFKPDSSQITRSDQTALFKHLQNTVNNKIVRQAGIILKDNNSGELRLLLKPEKMGTVRIRLELQDNHIAGKIFVDNSSVKDVFDHNLEALYRAFRESGYETSGLNVAVGNGNDGESNKPGRGIPKGTLKMLEDFVPSADEVIQADYLVNLVV